MNRWKICLCCILLFFLGLTVNLSAADNFLARGIKEYRAENFEEALDFFRKARKQQPGSSVAAFYLGLTYKQIGDFREAARHYRDALTLTPRVNDAYAELIEVLFNLDELREAREWIAKAQAEKISPANILFLQGMVLLRENRNREAIDAFNRAKELNKAFAQAADFQIAIALARDRRLRDALSSLKTVVSIDPTSDLAAFAEEYARAFRRVIDTHRTWRFNAGIAHQFDDNVLSKPSTEIAGVDITGQRDHSMLNTFGADYVPLLDGPWSFTGQFRFMANTHRRRNTHDTIVPSVSLVPGYNFARGAVAVPLSYSYVWLDTHRYMSILTARPMLNMIIAPGHIGQFSVGYTSRNMVRAPIDPDEDRDGNVFSASVGYLYPFAQGRGVFNLRYEHLRDDSQGKNWDNDGNRISAALLIPVTAKVNFSVSGDILQQRYDNVHTSFLLKREDNIYSGSAGITWELAKNFKLQFQYSHTRAESNIAVYDYRRNVYMTGIEFTF